MKTIGLLFSMLLLSACTNNNRDVNEFKTGSFQTYLDDSDAQSIAIRNDSIQIESYNNTKDTFEIKWTSNFEYVLTKVNPKNELDSTPFHVKITGFKKDSYTFKANYKGSNFKQKGKAVKIN